MKKTKVDYDLLLTYYISCQEELTRYGSRFDSTEETAEDLFVECHEKISRKYAIKSRVDYLKLMKTSMRNQFNDHFRRKVWLKENPRPELISPKPLLDLEETVCRREEFEFLRLALERMSEKDQEILREELKVPKIKSWVKYQALKRLERKVIEVIAERQAINQNKEGNQ
jgi:DNA-directed RNA polymerase specialized sigma24 family protein